MQQNRNQSAAKVGQKPKKVNGRRQLKQNRRQTSSAAELSNAALTSGSANCKRRRLHALLPKLTLACEEASTNEYLQGSETKDSAVQLNPRKKPAKTYLTKPLRLYQLVASSKAVEKPAGSRLSTELPQQQQPVQQRSIRSPRKIPVPWHRFEALDFDGKPVPTLGRLRLIETDQDESRMRWQHLCLVCQRQFQSPSQLFTHLEVHCQTLHRASRYLLGCQIRCCLCLELLSTWKRFRTHMQRHVGYQPFRCKDCAETFSTNGNLKRHIGRKHSGLEHCSD